MGGGVLWGLGGGFWRWRGLEVRFESVVCGVWGADLGGERGLQP